MNQRSITTEKGHHPLHADIGSTISYPGDTPESIIARADAAETALNNARKREERVLTDMFELSNEDFEALPSEEKQDGLHNIRTQYHQADELGKKRIIYSQPKIQAINELVAINTIEDGIQFVRLESNGDFTYFQAPQ